jgi:hypothetical protein
LWGISAASAPLLWFIGVNNFSNTTSGTLNAPSRTWGFGSDAVAATPLTTSYVGSITDTTSSALNSACLTSQTTSHTLISLAQLAFTATVAYVLKAFSKVRNFVCKTASDTPTAVATKTVGNLSAISRTYWAAVATTTIGARDSKRRVKNCSSALHFIQHG